MRNVADTEDSSDIREIDTMSDTPKSIRCACTSSFDVAFFRPLMQTSCFGGLVFADSKGTGLAAVDGSSRPVIASGAAASLG